MNFKELFTTNFQKGVSLIELLVFIGIFAFVVLILTDIFVTGVDIKLDSEATSGIEQDGRFILARLNYDVSRASAISVPVNAGDTASELSVVIDGETFTYALSGGNLQLTRNSGTDSINGSETNISLLQFQKITNPTGKETVRMTFTINSRTERKKGAETQTFQSAFGRR